MPWAASSERKDTQAAAGPKEGNVKLVVLGLMLVAGVYFALQTPAGQAMLLQAAAIGRGLTSNIVGNLTH